MHCHRLIAALGLSSFLVAGGTAFADSKVTVLNTPATVTRKTFDPNNLPDPKPPLKTGEDAVTDCTYSCEPMFKYTPVAQSLTEPNWCMVTIRIDEVTITIGLDITIWLPNNASAKLKNHEEGHREICEEVYKGAEKGAKDAGEELIGKTFEAKARTCDQAEKLAYKKVATDALCNAYGASIPEDRIGEIYDKLTAHGTNEVPEKNAIRDAFKQFKEEQKKRR
jgi:hypothetical protein